MNDLIGRQAAIDALNKQAGKPKFLPKCTFSAIYVNADNFCSKAERKADG